MSSSEDALENHHANLQLFTAICGASVTLGSSVLDPSACGFNGWNSTARTVTDPLEVRTTIPPRARPWDSAPSLRAPRQ